MNLLNYRGSHPKAAQVTAVPDAVLELTSSSSYEALFGSSAPPAAQLAAELATASQWTAMRVATESFLRYVKSLEAITWKTGLADLDKLNALFKVVETQDPVAIAAFPATQRLFDVDKVIGQKANAARLRNKLTGPKTAPSATAAEPAAPTSAMAPVATVSPAPSVASGTTGTGGGGKS